jgi:hypothetical protein
MGDYIDYQDVKTDLADQLDTTIYTHSVVESYIKKAEEAINRLTNRDESLIQHSITEIKDGDNSSKIKLLHYPVNSVTSVTVDDNVIAVSDYYLYDEEGTIILKNGVVSNPDDYQNITVVYNAGYDDKSKIPENIKELALLLTEEIIAAKTAGTQSFTETDKWGIEDFNIEKSTSDSESKGYKQIMQMVKNRLNMLATMDIDIIRPEN